MKNKLSTKVIHIAIIIIGTLFLLASSFHTNIWFDEAYSVGIANHTLSDIWKIGGNDVHPVLYYWMLRIVSLLTNGSILAYRLFSVLPVALLGVLGITHIKKDFGEKTGILFSFFTYFLPMMAVYANQIRMYSWAIYIVTILAIYAYRIYLRENTKKNWIIFGITSLSSLYIHYYGLMAAGLINLFLLIHFIRSKKWKKLKVQIIIGISQIILYIPWLLALLGQMENVSHGFWIGFTFPNTLYEIIGCQMNGTLNDTTNLFIGFVVNSLLFVLLGIIAFRNIKNKEINWKPAYFSIIIYFAVIIAALLITAILGSSILYYRYLFVITGLYIFAISYILSNAQNKYLIELVCIVVLTLGIHNNIIQIEDAYSKKNYKPIEYLKENVKLGDVFVYNEVGSGFICASIFTENKQYFYNKENWGVEEAYKAWTPQLEVTTTKDFLENCSERIWVIGSWNNSCYEELFNNENYKVLNNKYYETEYQNYPYNITLVEKIK